MTLKEEWDAADAACKKAHGAGSCAVSNDPPNGHPYMTDGIYHCSSSALVIAGGGINKYERVLDPSKGPFITTAFTLSTKGPVAKQVETRTRKKQVAPTKGVKKK